MRLPTEPVLELEFGEPMLLETESPEQNADKRDVKIKRTVVCIHSHICMHVCNE